MTITAPALPSPGLVFAPSPPRLTVVDHPPVVDPAEASSPSPRPQRVATPEVYRRRRLVALALVVGLVLGVASFGRQAGANRTPEAEAADAVTVVVAPGDTLWALAGTLAPDADPRPLAAALAELAGGTELQPGQRIVVPASLLD